MFDILKSRVMSQHIDLTAKMPCKSMQTCQTFHNTRQTLTPGLRMSLAHNILPPRETEVWKEQDQENVNTHTQEQNDNQEKNL